MKFFWSTALRHIDGSIYSEGCVIPVDSNRNSCRTLYLGTLFYTVVSTRVIGSDTERLYQSIYMKLR